MAENKKEVSFNPSVEARQIKSISSNNGEEINTKLSDPKVFELNDGKDSRATVQKSPKEFAGSSMRQQEKISPEDQQEKELANYENSPDFDPELETRLQEAVNNARQANKTDTFKPEPPRPKSITLPQTLQKNTDVYRDNIPTMKHPTRQPSDPDLLNQLATMIEAGEDAIGATKRTTLTKRDENSINNSESTVSVPPGFGDSEHSASETVSGRSFENDKTNNIQEVASVQPAARKGLPMKVSMEQNSPKEPVAPSPTPDTRGQNQQQR